jgi:small subunit ribosomal protein S17
MPRRVLEGSVVSAKSNKTVTVLVERRYMHPVYKKYVRRTDKFTAHDELNAFKEGDKVQIMECRPISKTKRWSVLVDGKPFDPVAAEKAKLAAPKAEKAAKPTKEKAAKKSDKAAEKKPAAKPAKAKKDA